MALAAKLTCADDDGRIITTPDPSSLKFVLLNAAARFSQASAAPQQPQCLHRAKQHRPAPKLLLDR